MREAGEETALTRIDKPQDGQTFEQFIQKRLDYAKGVNLAEGHVPSTELWLIDEGGFIGWVSIRHRLNEQLSKIGGHIGYWIRPSKRNKGYGTTILKLALGEAKKLGIEKALVTCDENNTGSRKIIEANGGVLESVPDSASGMPQKCRYWVTL